MWLLGAPSGRGQDAPARANYRLAVGESGVMCVGENATEALIKGLRTFEHICDVIGDRYEKALN